MPRTSNNRTCRGRAGGFTLAEVMMALGILGFALPMVAAAMLAGMLESKESFDNTMSTMLAENALAVLRCRVSHSNLKASSWGSLKMNTFQQLPGGRIHDDDLIYSPFGEQEFRTKFACVIMGRRMADNANDYLFVAMVYRKLNDSDTVAAVAFDYPDTTKSVNEDPSQTYVRLAGWAPGKSAMVSYLLMRMSLKP